MSKIYIKKIDESWIKVWSDDSGVEQELAESFTFSPKSAKFTPAFKSGRWDGKIRLFNRRNNTLPIGLYSEVVSCIERFSNGNYEILNVGDPVISEEDVDVDFLNSIVIAKAGQQIFPRDYQMSAVVEALKSKRKLLLSPTSSGKSAIIYLIIRYLLEQNPDFKIMLSAPSTGLIEQMFNDFKEYSELNGWSVEDNVQRNYSKFSKEAENFHKSDKTVLLTTWQSMLRKEDEYFNGFDAILMDEAHQGAAESIGRILSCANQVEYKIGCTGSLSGEKINELQLKGLFSEPFNVITTKELMDNGSVSELKIKCVILKHSTELTSLLSIKEFEDEYSYLMDNHARNKYLLNLISSVKGNTLVLFNRVEQHGKVLKDKLLAIDPTRPLYYIDGSVSATKREEIRQKVMKEETNAIVLASYGSSSTGFSITNIDNIVFASPSKSRIRNLQSIGRGLRKHEGKDFCVLYDIGDDLSNRPRKNKKTKLKPNFTYTHIHDRIALYEEQQFNYKVYRVDLS